MIDSSTEPFAEVVEASSVTYANLCSVAASGNGQIYANTVAQNSKPYIAANGAEPAVDQNFYQNCVRNLNVWKRSPQKCNSSGQIVTNYAVYVLLCCWRAQKYQEIFEI